MPKAIGFSDDPEPTVKAWEVSSSPDLLEDAGNGSSVAFSVLGIHGKIGNPKGLLGASVTGGDASDLEWPSLHAGELEVLSNGHGALGNMGKREALIGCHVGLGATVVSDDAVAGTVQHNLGTLLNCSDPRVGEVCGNDIAIVSRVPEATFSSPGSAPEDPG